MKSGTVLFFTSNPLHRVILHANETRRDGTNGKKRKKGWVDIDRNPAGGENSAEYVGIKAANRFGKQGGRRRFWWWSTCTQCSNRARIYARV